MGFRPCIDLHAGIVKQIVGSSLNDADNKSVKTNFESKLDASEYAKMYKEDNLPGGHVIMLGASDENKSAALSALAAYPKGLQVGGGINADNAKMFLDAGASHVIVTSYVFHSGTIDFERLDALVENVKSKKQIVLDLSCRRRSTTDDNETAFYVVTDRWQTMTDIAVTPALLKKLSGYCDEFLVHAVDVEGKKCGIQSDLVLLLASCAEACNNLVPITYAGGARNLEDLDLVSSLGNNKINVSIGSALDIFGGELKYSDVVDWHRKNKCA